MLLALTSQKAAGYRTLCRENDQSVTETWLRWSRLPWFTPETGLHNLVHTMTGRILVRLFHAMLLVASSHASSWGQRIFPDDIELLPPHRKQDFSDLIVEAEVDEYKICETEECKRVATEFLRGMNQSMDPCEDFYEFSCGGWAANVTIPGSSMYWNRDTLYQDIVYYRLKKILETEPNSSDILPVRQAKRWYRSCMDTARLQQRGIGPIESIVLQAGGWPMSMEDETWDPEENPWQSAERHYARLTGSHAFYDVNAHPPMEVREFRALRIGPPNLLLARDSLIKQGSYVELMVKAVAMFARHDKSALSTERMKKEVEEVAKFESDLRMLVAETESGYNMSGSGEYALWEGTDMDLEEFVEWYDETTMELADDPKSKINWMSVIQTVFDMANVKVDPFTPVYVNNIAYVIGIGKLLKRTSARTIANYVHWNFVSSMLSYTTEDLRDYIFKTQYRDFGVEESEARWLECAKQMKMTHAAAYIFAKNYFTNSTESAALAMLKTVQKALEENIDESNWLDEDAKTVAKDKLNSMKVFMGVPEWYRNETAIVDVYKGLIIRDEYFENALSYMRYERRKDFRRFRSWDDSEETIDFSIKPLTLNAEYSLKNSINLPPVNFQSPLFTPGLPDNVNYGLSGFTVGHEMGHGFDDDGIQHGNGMGMTRLTSATLGAYYRRADCFIKQFGGYYGKSESSTSGYITLERITQGENIADTTGLQAVFHAYETTNKRKPSGDSKLPGLEEFTDNQLFFISFAAAWCGLERPEYQIKQDPSKDTHSPARLRVIGAVSNTKDFAKVFNCPTGSLMNPIDKCNIWEKPGATPKAVSAWMKEKNHRRVGRW